MPLPHINVTEESSRYHHLEKMSTTELLKHINNEDKIVPDVVQRAIPQIEELVNVVADKMLAGGRLFYIGAGTSGRLGILDSSECVPTFGIPPGLVVGIIAGGEKAMTQAIEFAEDNKEQGWLDLKAYAVNRSDIVIGLAASGTTPYVIGAMEKCRTHHVTTGCIVCNPASPLSLLVDYPIQVVTGPEIITGSTRMKCGTAEKLVLNMISSAVMIQLGKVEDNSMTHMLLSNEKLIERGTRMIMNRHSNLDYEQAKKLLMKYGSVKKAIENLPNR